MRDSFQNRASPMRFRILNSYLGFDAGAACGAVVDRPLVAAGAVVEELEFVAAGFAVVVPELFGLEVLPLFPSEFGGAVLPVATYVIVKDFDAFPFEFCALTSTVFAPPTKLAVKERT